MIDGNELRKLFRERTAATKIIMKRCSGREISVDLTFRQNFVENGASCKSAVMDNTDSEYQFIAPAGAKQFHCGLMLNQSLTQPGDRVCFEILADDKVVGKYEAGYEDGKIEVDVPLHGVNQFVIRSRSLSKNAQVAFYWLDPEIITMQDEVLLVSNTANVPETLLPDFNYDGKAFQTSDWRQNTIELNKGNFIKEFISGDGKLKLSIEVRAYPEFNAVEYRPSLENISNEKTGVVENFRSLAWHKPCEFMPHLGHGGEYRSVFIRRNYGTKSNYMDYVAQPVILNANKVFPRNFSTKAEMVTDEGRSSATWLPFWGVDMSPSEGLLVGFGWTGAWRADFDIYQGTFSMSAGMLKTHFRMEPGEKFIQPSVLIMFRENESVEEAQNRFRKLLSDHFAPRNANGKIRENQIFMPVFGGIKTETHLKYIDLFEKLAYPYDVYNIDAGWNGTKENLDVFTGTWAEEVGNWQVNPAHPTGLSPIGEAAQKNKKTVSIWFEPERARRGTPITKDHPEWFIDIGDADLLLNLGHSQALQWLTDMTIDFFTRNHINQLHQDFNFNVLPYWAATDAPDRIGVTEIKYITGLYKYWDSLRAHSPEILIDHCASGGRRIDIESLRRGYVVWRSDAQCWPDNDITQNQIQNFYLTQWYPFHAGGVWVEPKLHDEYNFFSCVSNAIADCTFIYKHEVPDPKNYDYAYHVSLVREAIRMRPYFLGNYYQLSRAPENLENWCAYQLHCGDKGLVMIFRRPESPNGDEVFRLREIEPEAEYEIEIYGETKKLRICGKDLRYYSLSLPPRSFRLIYYTKVK
jgi:alpha-galactosidase